MARCTVEDITKWLQPLIESLGFVESEVKLSGTNEKGVGFLGDINFIQVNGKEASGKDKSVNFVVKCGKLESNVRDVVPIRASFENEAFMYTVLLPAFEKFQQEKNIKEIWNNHPKCYDTLLLENTEMIVLNNLILDGFKLNDCTEPFPRDHLEEILKSYGKFHAISHALKDQKPEDFEKLAAGTVDIFQVSAKLNSTPREGVPAVIKALVELVQEKNETVFLEKLSTMKQDFMETCPYPLDQYAVMNHGDCWNNNFMFKYNENGKLSEACLLDWQISRCVSPVFDLSYFLFTCASPEDLQEFEMLNDVYYKSYSEFLTKLGSDPNKMFPREELTNQWRKYGKFGIAMMSTLLKVCLAKNEDKRDFSDMKDHDLSDILNFKVETPEYQRRCFAVLNVAIEKGIL